MTTKTKATSRILEAVHETACDLHDAGFEKLNTVAGGGLGNEAGGIRQLGDIDLLLADADRLDQHDVECRQHYQAHGPDFRTESTELTPTGQRPDEYLVVQVTGEHPQTIPKQSPAADGAGGVDGQDAYRQSPIAPDPYQSGCQR